MSFSKLSNQKKIIYLGNFGNEQKSIGSQIKKTKAIYEHLRINNRYKITKINSEKFRTLQAPLILMKLIYELFLSNYIIVSLNQNGMKSLNYLLLKIINLFKNKKSIYITIGGWLPEFILDNEKIIPFMKKYNKIYVQAYQIEKELEKIGFENIENMRNFSVYNKDITDIFKENIMSINYNDTHTIRLVFFAVIRKEKGLDIVTKAIKQFNQNVGYCAFTLDIIGPVLDIYQKEFNLLINDNNDFCNYIGTIKEQDRIFKTLNKYDFMAFPTYHQGEGFPTAIVESFIAGVPVLASTWKYNTEIIKDKKNGLLFETNNLEDLISKLEWIYLNKSALKQMRLNSLYESENFHIKKILEPLLNELNS